MKYIVSFIISFFAFSLFSYLWHGFIHTDLSVLIFRGIVAAIDCYFLEKKLNIGEWLKSK